MRRRLTGQLGNGDKFGGQMIGRAARGSGYFLCARGANAGTGVLGRHRSLAHGGVIFCQTRLHAAAQRRQHVSIGTTGEHVEKFRRKSRLSLRRHSPKVWVASAQPRALRTRPWYTPGRSALYTFGTGTATGTRRPEGILRVIEVSVTVLIQMTADNSNFVSPVQRAEQTSDL
jgi:hypothetical protein